MRPRRIHVYVLVLLMTAALGVGAASPASAAKHHRPRWMRHVLHYSGSSCSQKLRIFLNLKGIPWESHPIDLPSNENFRPWFLGINPRGLVPVLVHDGARPLLRAADVRLGMSQVREGRGAVLATPVVDTVKIVDANDMTVVETLPRERLWAAQTPQFATRSDLERAHREAASRGVEGTDDAALLEMIGIRVAVVPSSGENFKVTVPEDLARAELLLRGGL